MTFTSLILSKETQPVLKKQIRAGLCKFSSETQIILKREPRGNIFLNSLDANDLNALDINYREFNLKRIFEK